MQILLLFFLFFVLCTAIQLEDEITVRQEDGRNVTHSLVNEVYTFKLIPTYYVPARILRHTIWTTSQEQNKEEVKRHLERRKRGEHHPYLSPVQLQELRDIIEESSSSHQQRSIPDEGLENTLGSHSNLSIYQLDESTHVTARRDIFGTKLCFHIPWVTTCDNKGDVDDIKDAMKGMNEELKRELDDIRETMDKRARELSETLTRQRELIDNLAKETSDLAKAIDTTAKVVRVQHTDLSNGIQATNKQIWHMQRSIEILDRSVGLLLSSDNRLVTAQPALTELFNGYKSTLEFLRNISYLPILKSGEEFDFHIHSLPSNSVRNNTEVEKEIQEMPGAYKGFLVQVAAHKSGPAIGMIPRDLNGLYCLNATSCDAEQISVLPIISDITSVYSLNANSDNQLYCISWHNSILLTTVAPDEFETTPKPTLLEVEDCQDLLLKVSRGTNVTGFVTFTQGYLIPFYSNCGDIFAKKPILGTKVWQSTYTNLDVFERHWVTSVCYISIPPENVGLSYYFDTKPKYVTDVHRGFEVDQFTINKYGEISSSLTFLYTTAWWPVYRIQLQSKNSIMIEEISSLGMVDVLWNLDDGYVTDASDSFFGEGNNGRNCIISQSPSGIMDNSSSIPWTNCYFQNLGTQYPVEEYLRGSITTSGINRFNNKLKTVFFQDMDNSWIINITARENVEFLSFFVQDKDDRCPTVVSNKKNLQGSCVLNLEYRGNYTIVVNTQIVEFKSWQAIQALPQGEHTVTSDGQACFRVTCTLVATSSFMTVTTPNVSVVSKSNSVFSSKVQSAISSFIGDSTLRDISNKANESAANIITLREELEKLNFSTQYAFANFEEERRKVQEMIDNIDTASCGFWCKFSTVCAFVVIIVVVMWVAKAVISVYSSSGGSLGTRMASQVFGFQPKYKAPAREMEVQ